ncbi:uncharacterized protein [Palaemon carinicauda]|uniref:uncharacterized protein n=1 Tax=Palaemon carinicauda TaxID=392227 RepID=UPI0035B5D837
MANKANGAEDMFNTLMESLNTHDLALGNCRGKSYDNASANSGRYHGLQAKVGEKNNLESWIPCTAHSLNLVGKNGAECCSSALHFFDFLEKLFVFFIISTHWYQLLDEALKKGDSSLTLKRVTTTRWSCRADATRALKPNYEQIKEVLKHIVDDIEEKSLKEYIVSKCDSFHTYEKEGEQLSQSGSAYKARESWQKRHNVRLNPLDYGHAEEVQLSPEHKFSCLSLISLYLLSVNVWKHTNRYQVNLVFFRHVQRFSSDEPCNSAEQLIRLYPDDLDITFKEELCQIVMFANIFTDEQPTHISTELFLYRLVWDMGVQDTSPNIEIALRIYLVLMVTNCSGERSFSKLKLIKNRLRTSMTRKRLVNLTMMSLETDILCELDSNEIISEFVMKKSRK